MNTVSQLLKDQMKTDEQLLTFFDNHPKVFNDDKLIHPELLSSQEKLAFKRLIDEKKRIEKLLSACDAERL